MADNQSSEHQGGISEGPTGSATGDEGYVRHEGGAAVAWPLAARAQTNPMKRLAVLMGISKDDPESKARLTALSEGF